MKRVLAYVILVLVKQYVYFNPTQRSGTSPLFRVLIS